MFVGLFSNLLLTDAHCLIIVLIVHDMFIDRVAGEIIRLVASVCVRVCVSVCLTFDLDFWNEGRP